VKSRNIEISHGTSEVGFIIGELRWEKWEKDKIGKG